MPGLDRSGPMGAGVMTGWTASGGAAWDNSPNSWDGSFVTGSHALDTTLHGSL